MEIQSSPPFVDQVESRLRAWILEGRFAPGERLNEVEVAQDLGVSRSPLREALQRLANQRLVNLVPRRGAFIVDFGAREVQDLVELREALEVAGVRLAAVRRSDDDIAALTAMLNETSSVVDTAQSTYPSDLDFHVRLIEAAGNQRLREATTSLYNEILLVRALSGAVPNRAQQALSEHRAVLDAIVARDADAAADAISVHLQNFANNMHHLFSTASDDAAEPAVAAKQGDAA